MTSEARDHKKGGGEEKGARLTRHTLTECNFSRLKCRLCLHITHYYIVVRLNVLLTYLLTHCFTGETEHMYVDSTSIKCYD